MKQSEHFEYDEDDDDVVVVSETLKFTSKLNSTDECEILKFSSNENISLDHKKRV
jgi:hypothetical protein